MLSIALPKGRLGNKVYSLLAAAGYETPELLTDTRRLVFENKEAGVRFFLVKPSDVPVYVEHGAADIGVAGKDILLEYAPKLHELLDLGLGRCRMAVAGMSGFVYDGSRPLRVATKFPNIARRYYAEQNIETELIHLYGSIELAPLLDLSDVIVDIVETGTTLKENNLEVLAEVLPISARLVAGPSAYVFKKDEILRLVQALKKELSQ